MLSAATGSKMIQITQVSAARRADWDALVAREPTFALLQSWRWGELKERAGWRVYRIAAEQQGKLLAGAQLLLKTLPGGLAGIAYVPRGPLGAWLDSEIGPMLFGALHQISRQHRAIFLRIEPPIASDASSEQVLCELGFRSSRQSNQPRATIIVDLQPGLDNVLASLHHKTRYNIRYAARNGVLVREGGAADLPLFQQLIRQTGRRGGFSPRSPHYYAQEWAAFAPHHLRMLIASYQGRPIAANVSAVFGEHAAYLHGASSGEYANLQPNYLLMWEAITWSKARNCHSFDLWGIPDEVGLAVQGGGDLPTTERSDGLWGVYRFKRGFSREVRLYAGAHDYVYAPALYALATNHLISGEALERVAIWIDAIRNV